jgi:environmental stress-induced protein Ves
MISVFSPESFKTIPWKNGKGETIELAINDGGTLDDFIWRLSMASVVEDGVFSDFSGYQRNLILIEGNGISLQHDDNKIDKLSNLLAVANFDGACRTVGNLHAGAITDFNIITHQDKCRVNVETYIKPQTVELKSADLCFVYSLSGDYLLTAAHQAPQTITAGHLLKLSTPPENNLSIKGQQLIIIYVDLLAE